VLVPRIGPRRLHRARASNKLLGLPPYQLTCSAPGCSGCPRMPGQPHTTGLHRRRGGPAGAVSNGMLWREKGQCKGPCMLYTGGCCGDAVQPRLPACLSARLP